MNNRAPFGPPPRRSHHDYMPQNSRTEDPEWGTVCKDVDLLNVHHNSSQTLQPVIQELASTHGLACDVCVRQDVALVGHTFSFLKLPALPKVGLRGGKKLSPKATLEAMSRELERKPAGQVSRSACLSRGRSVSSQKDWGSNRTQVDIGLAQQGGSD